MLSRNVLDFEYLQILGFRVGATLFSSLFLVHRSSISLHRSIAPPPAFRRPGYPTVPFTKLKLPFTNKRYTRQIQMENGQSAQTRGALIVLEGLDRSGKTSQSSRLLAFLEGIGFSAESWRFPDRTTGVGRMISSYLASESQLNDRAIHLLFSANRWEKSILMEKKLKGGTTLIVDRYSYSGVAFSSAKGLDIDWCKAPEFGLLAPDLVLYLDIPPEKAAERGGYGGERYEQLEFQQKVSEKYQILRDPSWQIIDAGVHMEDVEKQLRELVLDCVTTCRKGKPLSRLWLSDDDAIGYNLGRIREVPAVDGDKQDEGFIMEKDEGGSPSDDSGENLSDLNGNKRVKKEHRNEAST